MNYRKNLTGHDNTHHSTALKETLHTLSCSQFMTETEIVCCFVDMCVFLIQMYNRSLKPLKDEGHLYPIRLLAWLKNKTCSHSFIQFLHAWLVSLCLHTNTHTATTTLHRHSNKIQLSHLPWLMVEQQQYTTALIKSLVYCIPQCNGAFHCTCDKGITGPAGYREHSTVE